MPRILNPGSINTGTGLAPEGSVEPNALVYPSAGNSGLAAHINDPSRAHMAEAVGVLDTGGHFVTDSVEGALGEVVSSAAATQTNGLVSGGTHTAVGLNLTLDATVALVGGTERTLTGLSVVLSNNQTQYVYYNPTTSALSVSLTPPALTNDPVVFAQLVTSGGVVASATDARLFILDSNRKPSFTVRASGGASDRNAEGAFESLAAAFMWITMYGGTGGANQVENYRVQVRGSHTISATLTVPVAGLILEGDGGATLVTGGVVSPLLQVNQSDVKIRNINFVSNNATSTALGVAADRVVVEDCRIIPGTGTWDTGVYHTSGQNLRIQGCAIQTQTLGVQSVVTDQLWMVNCQVTGPGGGNTGLFLASSGAGSNSVVQGVRITGYDTGIFLQGVDQTISDSAISGCIAGINSSATRGSFKSIRVDVDSATGVTGLYSTGVGAIIQGCTFTCTRTVWTGETPVGIDAAATTSTEGAQITGSSTTGFWNRTTGNGYGVRTIEGHTRVTDSFIGDCAIGAYLTATAIDSRVTNTPLNGCLDGLVTVGACDRLVVSNCTVSTDTTSGRYGLYTTGSNVTIQGCHVRNNRTVFAGGEALVGIYVLGANTTVSNSTIFSFLNTADNSGRGLYLTTSATNAKVLGTIVDTTSAGLEASGAATGLLVSGCTFTNVAIGITTPAPRSRIEGCEVVTDVTRGLYGIYCAAAVNASVVGCTVRNLRTVWVTGTPVGILLGGTRCQAIGNTIQDFYNPTGGLGNGVELAAASYSKVAENLIEGSPVGVRVGGGCMDVRVEGNTINGGSMMSYGVASTGGTFTLVRALSVNNNTISNCTLSGVYLTGHMRDVVVSCNTIDNYLSADPYNPTARGIWMQGVGTNPISQINISGNNISRSTMGITLHGLLDHPIKQASVVNNTVHHCGVAQDLSGGVPDTFVGGGACGVGIEFGTNCQVEGNNLYRMGILLNDSAVESFPTLGGAIVDSQSKGVFLRNCDAVSVQNNQVKDSMASNLGENYGIVVQQQSSGTSSTLFATTDFQVVANKVTWQTSPALAGNGTGLNGIHVVVDRGTDAGTVFHTMTNVQVVANQVRSTRGTGIWMRAIEGATGTNLLLADNQLDNVASAGAVASAGIALSLEANATSDPAYLNEVKLLGNSITTTGAHGILVRGERSGGVNRWVVSENSIQGAQRSGIYATTITGATAVVIRDWSMSHNHISEYGVVADSCGIGVDDTAVGASALARIDILDNTIASSQDLGTTGSGIALRSTDVEFKYLRVNRNSIGHRDAETTGVLNGYGIYLTSLLSVATETGADGLEISGNTINTTDHEPLYVFLQGTLTNFLAAENIFSSLGAVWAASIQVGYAGVLTTNYSSGWHINNNIFESAVASGKGVRMFHSGGYSLRDLHITNNQFNASAEYGLHLSVQDTNSVSNQWYINGNTFQDMALVGLNVILGAGGASTSSDMLDMVFKDNQFYNCASNNTTSTLYVGTRAPLLNLSVQDNQFYNCATSLDNDAIGTVWVNLGDDGTNLSVQGNTLLNCGGVGVLVSRGAYAANIQSMVVNGNTIRSQKNTAIGLDLALFATTFSVGVEGNRINTTGGTGVVGSQHGILIEGGVIGPSNFAVENNHVASTGNFSTASSIKSGIYLNFGGGCSNLNVTGNNISGAMGDGIYLGAVTSLKGVLVGNNTITGVNMTGVHWAVSSTPQTNTSIQGNSVASLLTTNTLYRWNVGSSDIVNFNYSHNTGQGGGVGFEIATGYITTPGTAKGIVMVGNAMSGTATTDLKLSAVGIQSWEQPSYASLTMSSNQSTSGHGGGGVATWGTIGLLFGGSKDLTGNNLDT